LLKGVLGWLLGPTAALALYLVVAEKAHSRFSSSPLPGSSSASAERW
jgi:hypothetical protein